MRRAPARPLRACILRKWCPVSHVTFEAPLLASHFSLHSSHSTLHTALFALRTSLHTAHTALVRLHTSHFRLHTSHFTVHTSHFSLLSSHFTLHTSHFTLHTALFTPHTSHCTLHTPHFISSELFSPYPSSSLLISSLLICHLSFHESLPRPSTTSRPCVLTPPFIECIATWCKVSHHSLTPPFIECIVTPQPQPPHTRGTCHRWLQPLYTEKHKVSCSGFPPKT